MTRAPRVLVSGVVLAQPMGGVRRHNAELLPRVGSRLVQAGGGLTVLTGPEPLPFGLPDEVAVVPSTVPAGPPTARALRESRALADELRRAHSEGRPYDLVHTAHHPVPRGLDAPLTLTVHDLRSLDFEGAPTVRRWLGSTVIGRAVRRARRVFAVSEWVASRLREHFDLPGERIAIVPNGCDHLPLRERRSDPAAPLLHVGHLEPRKNLELLVDALAVDPSLPDLQLVGTPKGDARERLEARARSARVLERIEFLGAITDDELAQLYASAACVVLPSHLEGFGIPAVEARRAGAPLAVARTSALPEVAGPHAALFAVDDAYECARAVHSAMERADTVLEASLATWDDAAEAWYAGWCAAIEDA